MYGIAGRVLAGLAAVVVAIGGVVVLVGTFDGSGVSTTDAPSEPGRVAAPQGGGLGRTLRAGNLVLAYRTGADAPAARAWADRVGGPGGSSAAALIASGQAVLTRRRPQVPRFALLAWRRIQTAATLTDPVLTAFADTWLGRGAPG